PLVAPATLPTRIEPLAKPAMAAALGAGASSGDAGSAGRARYAPPESNASAVGRAGDDSAVLTDEEAWAAVIGDSNTHYYLERFDRLSSGGSAPWHWPALLVTWYWMLYRKMWVPALIYFFAPSIVLTILTAMAPKAGVALTLAWWLALVFVPAVMANGWYYKHCTKKIADVRARGGSKDQMLARLEAAGGTSNIIVIIVAIFVLIAGIGILAAIALPAYQSYTVKAKVADALMAGRDVADAVGKRYEQSATLPTSGDVERMVSEAPHHSKYLRGVDFDSTTGVLTLKVEPTPSIQGSILMVPSASGNHHLDWTCTTEDLARYAPAACRGQGAPSR
ncbi:MAG: DUF2628 domain-containing protein, partial [Betaproteobacteria bacterium]